MKRPWFFLFALVLVMPGCSDPTKGVVSGSILVDGEPAETGSIAFFPVDGKSTTAGAEIMEGKYTATVPVGRAKVEIRVSEVVGETKLYNTPDSPVQPITQEVLPPKYNDESELLLDVKPGKNEQNYELTTK